MDWTDSVATLVETTLRPNLKLWQQGAFLGAMVFFGIVEVWFSRDPTGVDRRRRWPANFGLTAINIVVLSLLPISVVSAADYAARNGLGIFNQLGLALAVTLPAGILLRSLASYLVHVGLHQLPLLWRIHRVHHADTQVDISTTVRLHPLEFLVTTPVLVTTVVLFGVPPAAVMLYEVFHAGMVALNHANVRLPAWLERPLGWLLVTPAMHRIHHSMNERETNSNYGATLSLWDWVFGTATTRTERELVELRPGLTEFDAEQAHSLIRQLALPVLSLPRAPVALSARMPPATSS